MRIYLDVSCLNRPFDDQRQARIRLEAEAVLWVLRKIDSGEWLHVSSEMAVAEISATTDPQRRARVLTMLPQPSAIMEVTAAEFERAAALQRLGVRAADAVHVAAAESQQAAVLLTCDDQLLRVARRRRRQLQVRVSDPVTWVKEHEDQSNA